MSPRRSDAPRSRVAISLPATALVALATALAGTGGGAALSRAASENGTALKERLARLEGRLDATDRIVNDLREARAATDARLHGIETSLTSIDKKLDRLSDGVPPHRR